MTARRPLLRLSLILLSLLASGAAEQPASATAGRRAVIQPAVERALARESSVRVIVTLREPPALGSARLDVGALRAQVGALQAEVLAALPPHAEVIYRYQAVPALALRVDANAAEALAAQPSVVEVALDGVGSAAMAQSVPLINADDLHLAGVTGAGATVAVLDSGIDTDHPDLANDIAFEACFLSGGGCPAGPHPAEDDHGHGTNVSGIITSGGAVAPKGVAPDAKIAAYKVLDSSSSGFFSDWTAALDDIIANHLSGPQPVHLVNMSLQSGFSCAFARAMATAISALRNAGVATFVAAGNHGAKNTFFVPACIADGISIGATWDADLGNQTVLGCADATAPDRVTCWSDSHDSLDLLGPGAAITSTGLGGATSTFFGTSQATPHAAGVAALLRQAFPGSLTVDDLEARLEATGTLLTDDLRDSNPATNRATPRVDARVALLTDDGDDFDKDGCANGQEYGANAQQGGRRNPLSLWDVFDTRTENGLGAGAALTGLVSLEDLLHVAGGFGQSGSPAIDPLSDASAPAYHTRFDRGSRVTAADPWDLRPPEGAIGLGDVLDVAAQFGLAC